ncbi:hypothetical protein EX30DRAFT_368142 [Ascodesmis nigricans]|uniref:Cytochrome c oxidase, subunit VIb n=1 Tax=Ascodesmis nigricans TaxID=341454 RepID=A0A4S2N718_9PEZI|nr:hypothetical protein EX30DRAFT_368142 [Ascodesmis nigricans]
MGWLSGSSAPAAKEPVAPNRSQRAVCWEGRDKFFSCLDKHDITDAIAEKEKASKECRKEELEFEKACVGSWVEYFKKQRVMLKKREKMMDQLKKEGAQKIDLPKPL